MIDKETQLDESENIPEVIYNYFKKARSRKVSIPVMPTSFCFNIETQASAAVLQSRLPSKCSSKRDLKPHMRRNNSEFNIRPPTTQMNPIINLTFTHNVPRAAKKTRPFNRLQLL